MLFVTRQLGEKGWVIIQDKCVATMGSGSVCECECVCALWVVFLYESSALQYDWSCISTGSSRLPNTGL